MVKNSRTKKELMAKMDDLRAWPNEAQAELASLHSTSAAGEASKSLAAFKGNEELFRLIAMSTPDHILIQDQDLRYVWVANPQLGLTVENMIGKTDFEILPGEDANRLTKVKRKVMKTGVPEFVNVPLTSTVGEIERFEGYYLPWRNKDGQIAGILGYFRNVTERVRIEEALKNSEERYRTLFNGMTEGFALHEMLFDDHHQPCDFRFLEINPAFEKLTGLKRDEVIGRCHNALLPGDDPKWVEIYGKVVLTGEPVHFDNYSPALKQHYEVFAYRPAPNQFAVLFINITQRKETEKELKQAHDELELHVQQRTEQLAKANDDLIALSVAERHLRQLAETLAEGTLALSESLNIRTVLSTLLDYLSLLVPFDCANVMMLETDTRLAICADRGYEQWLSPEQLAAISFNIQEHSILGEMFESCRSKLIDDTQGFPGWENLPETKFIRNWLGVPLIAGGKVIGVCSFDKTEPGTFTTEHVHLVELMVHQAAVAVQNAWLFEQVKAGRERLKSLSQRQVEIQEAERRYVAFELHDEAGQALTSLKFGLAQLEQETDSTARLNRISILKRTTDTVMEDLHRLAMDLRPASLDHLGMVAAIRQYVQMIGERYDLTVQFMAQGFEGQRLKQEIETAVYRIAQEALTNVVRHARATLVDVLLERRQECMVLIIEDNGIGFEPGEATYARSGRLGLAGIQERAEMLGGTLAIESRPGKGTTIVVEVPVPQ